MLQNMARELDVTFRILHVMPTYSDNWGGSLLFEFNVPEEKKEQVMSYLKKNYYYDNIEVEKSSSNSYLILVNATQSCGCAALSISGCFLSGCEVCKDGAYINLYSGTNGSLIKFIEALEERDFSVEILKKRTLNINDELTCRQRDVLRTAFQLGYFDVPKRISLKELSDIVGVSPSSVDEIIKRAEKKILSHYLLR
jgi:predicted DNA binding protein